jgi:hypothetical protein
MILDVYTEIDSILQARKKISELRLEDDLNEESDLIADFLRFLGDSSSCLFFSDKDKESKMDQILAFIRMISDKKPKELIRFENRFFNKLERDEDLRSFFKENLGIAFLNKETSRIRDLGMKSQILMINMETLIEKWKKLAHKDEIRFPKVIAVNSNTEFSWEKLNAYNEVTSKIVICDRQLFRLKKVDYLQNILPMLKSLLPNTGSYRGSLRVILIGARNSSYEQYTTGWTSLDELIDFLKSELKGFPNIIFTLATLDHRKVHDRLIFTDYFSFNIGHCFDVLKVGRTNNVKDNVNTTFNINGFGEIISFSQTKKQYEQQREWFNDEFEKDSNNIHGVKKKID